MENIKQVIMSTEVAKAKDFFAQNSVRAKFEELLGKRSSAFITTVLQVVNNNDLLKKADPTTVYNAAAVAATLDLPVNPSLGFAYIVPYGGQAQFQMGYKGLIQLAQRSGQYKTIGVSEVYENQIDEINFITKEVKFKNVRGEGKVAGFYAWFSLLNGFEKAMYMSRDEMESHAKKYSQMYKRGKGIWAEGEDGFTSMGKKTVLKLLVGRFGPMSIEMQKAIQTDQGVIKDDTGEQVEYMDNQAIDLHKEADRALAMISDCTKAEELEAIKSQTDVDVFAIIEDEYNAKMKEVSK